MSNEKHDYVPGSGVSVRMNDFLVRKISFLFKIKKYIKNSYNLIWVYVKIFR